MMWCTLPRTLPNSAASTPNPAAHSKLGGQALVLDVEGTWSELTGVVNNLAANLTSQVRSIAFVTTAVARGDLTQKIEGVSASGEMLDLVDTINNMIDQLNIFAYVGGYDVRARAYLLQVGGEEVRAGSEN